MRRFVILLLVGGLIAVLSGLNPLSAQEAANQEIINPEAEYLRIRTMAFEGKLEEAAADARKLLKAYPEYGDVRILLGRILAWQKNYDEAAAVIDTLLLTEPDNADALSARRDISLWSKDNTAVETDFRTGYSFDYFEEPYTRFWQVFNVGAGHRFGWGPAAAGVNIGNLITDPETNIYATEFQVEAEAYPRISDKNYAYVAYAYSPGNYFPTHRGAFEFWEILPKGWGISAGLNYYYFDRNIFIGLASVEKYIGKYWLSGKCYVYFKDDGPRTSFYLNARRYFTDFNYLQLTLGTGTAPDEPYNIREDINRLNAHSVRLAYNFAVNGRFTIRLGAGYSREQYDGEAGPTWRNRFEGNAHLIYAIKMK
ncbi:MAG: YaiO family outer membrane beta-barrel protein [Bacteroidales bacterium]|jgi:YaiO family outer membrane protein|nr:YaiO family outer membrane beta-barrel protein [Bacteroidales bacterium]MDI9553051.1 YaiO family outer membrane beta-barrel protein [Bacteroidota bacterium]